MSPRWLGSTSNRNSHSSSGSANFAGIASVAASFSATSGSDGRSGCNRPGVSITNMGGSCRPLNAAVEGKESGIAGPTDRVTPGLRPVLAVELRTRALRSVLLPTLGRPTIMMESKDLGRVGGVFVTLGDGLTCDPKNKHTKTDKYQNQNRSNVEETNLKGQKCSGQLEKHEWMK